MKGRPNPTTEDDWFLGANQINELQIIKSEDIESLEVSIVALTE